MSIADVYRPDATPWRDGKRYAWLLGLFIPMLPLVGAGLVEVTGFGLFWWFGPLFVYGVVPVLDLLIGKDAQNPPEAALVRLERDRYYRWCTYLFVPLQLGVQVWACGRWTGGALSMVDCLGLAATVGVVGGAAINTAHELGHKRQPAERWLAKIALAQTGYGHFIIEHNRGHHVRVATPEDPASARLGESFWAFLPRTVVGSLKSAWALEARRLGRKGNSPLSPSNEAIQAWTMTLLLFGVLLVLFGWSILPWLLIQAVFGFCLLEVVNYIEHYGLLRQQDAEGRHERCEPRHSWNSNNLTSNLLLYHLQRHSDHHANPMRRYQALRHCEDAPELPSGYGTMIVLAYLSPLWRRIMDPRVIAHYGDDASLANIQPSKRAEFGLPT